MKYLLLALLAALPLTSCVIDDPGPYNNNPRDSGGAHNNEHREDDYAAIPPFTWNLGGGGTSYHLDILMGTRSFHIGEGRESLSGREIPRNNRLVPRGTLSAFEVLLPDGEIDLYWVEEGRPGSLVVYRKFYDPQEDRWDRELRLRSINY